MPTSILTDADKAEIVALCTRAFQQDFATLFDYVKQSMHVLARIDGVLIGHATWSERWLHPQGVAALHTAYVDAVATEPEYQGRGIGSSVISRLMEEIRDFDLSGLSTPRVAFYARLGWERWRGPTAVQTESDILPTPDDTVMIWRTPKTPALDTTTLLVAEPRGGQPW